MRCDVDKSEEACGNCVHWEPDSTRCWGYCETLDMRSPACACCKHHFERGAE